MNPLAFPFPVRLPAWCHPAAVIFRWLVYHAIEEREVTALELALGRQPWVQDDLMTKDIAVKF